MQACLNLSNVVNRDMCLSALTSPDVGVLFYCAVVALTAFIAKVLVETFF